MHYYHYLHFRFCCNKMKMKFEIKIECKTRNKLSCMKRLNKCIQVYDANCNLRFKWVSYLILLSTKVKFMGKYKLNKFIVKSKGKICSLHFIVGILYDFIYTSSFKKIIHSYLNWSGKITSSLQMCDNVSDHFLWEHLLFGISRNWLLYL